MRDEPTIPRDELRVMRFLDSLTVVQSEKRRQAAIGRLEASGLREEQMTESEILEVMRADVQDEFDALEEQDQERRGDARREQ